MRAVVQRVSRASVGVVKEGSLVPHAAIEAGFLILLGVREDDTETDAGYLADKVATLRVFEDNDGKLNRSLLDTGGSALVVSNFTLYGDCRKGRRPSFTEAAPGPLAEMLYQAFASRLKLSGVSVQLGVFGARMEVALVNDGPITLLLDSRRAF